MNQTVIIRGNTYTIENVDQTKEKFLLKGVNGQLCYVGINSLITNVYAKEIQKLSLESFANVDEYKAAISNVDMILKTSPAYGRIKEFVPEPHRAISDAFLNEAVSKLVDAFEKLYPNKKVVHTETLEEPKYEPISKVEPAPQSVGLYEGAKQEVNNNNGVLLPPEGEEWTLVTDIDVMGISLDQKNIHQYLKDKYRGYMVNKDFSKAWDPRNGKVSLLSFDNTGLVQMIAEEDNNSRTIEKTMPLTEARKIYIQNLSIEELDNFIKTSKNIAEINYANQVKAGLKNEYDVEETQLIETAKIKKLVRDERTGFISNLAISFLVGVLGGVTLMVVGNAISILF